MDTQTITIPKQISGGEELMIVRRRDFLAFQKWQNEVMDAMKKIERGRDEYKTDKKKMLRPLAS